MSGFLFNNPLLSDCQLVIRAQAESEVHETTLPGHFSVLVNGNQYFRKLAEFHRGQIQPVIHIDLITGGKLENAIQIIEYIYGSVQLDQDFVAENQTLVDFFGLDLSKIPPIHVDISDIMHSNKISIERFYTFNGYDSQEEGFDIVISDRKDRYVVHFIVSNFNKTTWREFILFVDTKIEKQLIVENYYMNYIINNMKYNRLNHHVDEHVEYNVCKSLISDYDTEYQNIRIPFPPIKINLKEVDRKFIEKFSPYNQADMLEELRQVGLGNLHISEVSFIHHIKELFLKGTCSTGNEWMPKVDCQ